MDHVRISAGAGNSGRETRRSDRFLPDRDLTNIPRPVVGLLLAVAISAGFWIRVHHLREESLWYDEIVSVRCLSAPSLIAFLRELRAADPPMMPLYFIVQYSWASAFGSDVAVLRMLSVFLGALAVPLTFLIGRKLYGDFAGLAAAMCAALSPGGVYYSQEIRMYALFATLVLCMVYTFLRVIEHDSFLNWLAHAAASFLLVWTHLLAPLYLAPAAVVLILYHRRQRGLVLRWFGLHAALGLTVLAWLATVDAAAVRAAASWIAPPGASLIIPALLGYAGRAWVPTANTWLPFVDTPRLPMKIAVASLALASLALLAWRALKTRNIPNLASVGEPLNVTGPEALVLLLLWAILPLSVLVLLSHLGLPCFVPRYAMPSSLAFCLLYGGAAGVPRPGWRLVTFVAWATAVLGSQQAAVMLTPGPVRADYASAAHYIAAHGQTFERVIVVEWHEARSLSYHLPQQGASNAVESVDLDTDPGRILRVEAAKFWVVLQTRPKRQPFLKRFEAVLDDHGFSYAKTTFPANSPLTAYRVERRSLSP